MNENACKFKIEDDQDDQSRHLRTIARSIIRYDLVTLYQVDYLE
jgi:hypothetical protein